MNVGNDYTMKKNCNNCKYKDLQHPDDLWFENCFLCVLSNRWKPIDN